MTHRNLGVDGLRGVASLLIAVHHGLLVFAINGVGNLWMIPLHSGLGIETLFVQILLWLSNGSFFVMVFMAIAGWAASGSYERSSSLLGYYVRRARRLIPVYWITTILLYLATLTHLAPIKISGGSVWWGWWLQAPISLKELLAHLTFIKPGLGGATWTMSVFVVGALVYPLLYRLRTKSSLVTYILMFVNLLLLAWITQKDQYLLFGGFLLGTLIDRCGAWFARAEKKISPTWLLVATLLIMSARYLWLSRWVWVIEAAWAFVVVGVVVYNKRSIFENKYLGSLGKISYSYYLWHFLVLYAITPLLVGSMGGGSITLLLNTALSVVATVPVAYLSYWFIEQNQWIRSS